MDGIILVTKCEETLSQYEISKHYQQIHCHKNIQAQFSTKIKQELLYSSRQKARFEVKERCQYLVLSSNWSDIHPKKVGSFNPPNQWVMKYLTHFGSLVWALGYF